MLTQLAVKLEDSYLKPLLQKSHKWVSLLIRADGSGIDIDLEDQSQPTGISDHCELAKLFINLKIKKIRLDCRLESNQICEALISLWQAAPHLHSTTNQPPLFIHNNRNLAAKFRSHDGVQQFCARMCFLPEENIFQVEYSYCELYYTYILNIFLDKSSFNQGHRALFAIAPKAGILTGLGIFLLIIVPMANLGTAIIGGLLTGALVSYLITTMASILYDQEHRDLLLKESSREISALAHFPVNNPHPIMKLKHNGELLYNNPASAKILAELGIPAHHIHEILPDNYKELACQCTNTSKEPETIEVNRHNRTLRYKITQFPDEQAVMFAGTDVTRLKELEIKLLEMNHSLEKKVSERTKELLRTQDVTILSLSDLAEIRDPETGAHLNRTRRYIRLLAKTLRKHPKYRAELDDGEIIDQLYRSAPLHDIGKIGIADAILLKPDPLTPEEFEEMKKHPVIGGDSLRWAEKQLGENSFLRYAREIAYNHHERWDGSGYPAGLSKEEIPLSGRLMALADVYDALVNKRVYKEAFSHEKSKKIILKGRGKHFDPDIVDAFLKKEGEFQAIAEKFRHTTKNGAPYGTP